MSRYAEEMADSSCEFIAWSEAEVTRQILENTEWEN